VPHSGRLLPYSKKIRLKKLAQENTLSYFPKSSVMNNKSIITLNTGVDVKKTNFITQVAGKIT
jgi:hypothetical protein